MSKTIHTLLIVLILTISVFFRFYRITEIPLGLRPDEALNGNQAVEMLSSGQFRWFSAETGSQDGLFGVTQALAIKSFGNEPWTLRVVSAVFGLLTILGLYLMTKKVFSKNFQFLIFNFPRFRLRLAEGGQSNFNKLIFKQKDINLIALLSSFFLAVNYSHIYLSRIGNGAIMLLFTLVFAIYGALQCVSSKGIFKKSLFALLTVAAILSFGTPSNVRNSLSSVWTLLGVVTAGVVSWLILETLARWLKSRREQYPEKAPQLKRIHLEIIFLFLILLSVIPLTTYKNYFWRWAYSPNTYFEFTTDMWHLGTYLNDLPMKTMKYVVANRHEKNIRGMPISAQTIMFATETSTESGQAQKNIIYLLPDELDRITLKNGTIVTFLDGSDVPLIKSLQKKFPQLKVSVPGDFIVLANP